MVRSANFTHVSRTALYNKEEIKGWTFSFHAEIKDRIYTENESKAHFKKSAMLPLGVIWNSIKTIILPLRHNVVDMAFSTIKLADAYSNEPPVMYRKVQKPHIENKFNKYVIVKNGPVPDKYGNTGPLSFEFVEESDFIELYDSLERVKHWNETDFVVL